GDPARERGHGRRLRQAVAAGVLPVARAIQTFCAGTVAPGMAAATDSSMGSRALHRALEQTRYGRHHHGRQAAHSGSVVKTIISQRSGVSPPMASLISSRI